MIFPQVKDNKSVLVSFLVLDCFVVFIVSLTDAETHFGFLNSSNLSVSEQSYQVFTLHFLN